MEGEIEMRGEVEGEREKEEEEEEGPAKPGMPHMMGIKTRKQRTGAAGPVGAGG